MTTLGGIQRLFLVLCPGLILGGAERTIWGTRNQTRICHIQQKYLTPFTISLAMVPSFQNEHVPYAQEYSLWYQWCFLFGCFGAIPASRYVSSKPCIQSLLLIHHSEIIPLGIQGIRWYAGHLTWIRCCRLVVSHCAISPVPNDTYIFLCMHTHVCVKQDSFYWNLFRMICFKKGESST